MMLGASLERQILMFQKCIGEAAKMFMVSTTSCIW